VQKTEHVRRPWTAPQVKQLVAEYGTTSTAELAARFGRTPEAIRLMAIRKGVTKKFRPKIDPGSLVKAWVDAVPIDTLSALHGVRWETVRALAGRLGLDRVRARGRPMLPDEHQTLYRMAARSGWGDPELIPYVNAAWAHTRISRGIRTDRPMLPDRDLLQMWAEGLSLREISRRSGKPVRSLQRQVNRLGLSKEARQ
jgi:hypothetical protein